MSFNENQHNRAADGKFTEKTGTEPDNYFSVQLAETLRTIRERDQREAEADAPAGPRIVRDQFGNFPPGVTLDDLVIDGDKDGDEGSDASRKFSSLRSYPGMNASPSS